MTGSKVDVVIAGLRRFAPSANEVEDRHQLSQLMDGIRGEPDRWRVIGPIPDVIEMPDRSGYEVAEELSREYGPACPVLIAVTAHRTAEAKALVNAFEIALNNAERSGKLAPAFALG